jgi:hypothetical protein
MGVWPSPARIGFDYVYAADGGQDRDYAWREWVRWIVGKEKRVGDRCEKLDSFLLLLK